MKVKSIMTSSPACCTPDSSLEEAARMMIDFDCGEIPVIDDFSTCVPVGVITDRDITCRSVGKGLNPLEMIVGQCMSTPPVTVMSDDSIDECCRLMEEKRIRRVPVVDASGKCVGIVALADIARNMAKQDSGEVLQEVSNISLSASNVK